VNGSNSNEPVVSVFFDGQSKTDVAVIALVSEDEFTWAQIVIPEWHDYSGYQEWRESREGLETGLTMAGVNVKVVPVVLTSFLGWCRDTKTSPSARALETFAGRSYDLRQGRDGSLGAAGERRH
jgi:hypothetical protein